MCSTLGEINGRNRGLRLKSGPSLFLLAAVATSVLSSQGEVFLYPVLQAPGLQQVVFWGSLTGLLLGIFLGGPISSRRTAAWVWLRGAPLLTACCLALAGIFHPASFHVTEGLAFGTSDFGATEAPVQTISYLLPWLIALLSMILPLLLGIGLRLLVEASEKKLWVCSCALSGAVPAALAMPFLLYRSPGVSATLELLSLLAALAAIHIWSKGIKPLPARDPLNNKGALRANVPALLLGLCCVLPHLVLQLPAEDGGASSQSNNGYPAQRARAALLSAFFHPRPEEVLILGPDSGTAALEITRDAPVMKVTWVNPHRDFNDQGRRLFEACRQPKRTGKITILELPERLFTRHTNKRFDLILLPPSPFGVQDPHTLFSFEFYREAGALLKKRGLLCHLVLPHAMEKNSFITLLSTMNRACSNLHVFVDHRRSEQPLLALVGSMDGIVLSTNRLSNRMQAARCLEEFERIGLGPGFIGLNFITSREMLDVKLPPIVVTDKAGNLFLSRADRHRANLLESLRFLSTLQIPPFPWFQAEPFMNASSGALRRYASYLQRVGRIMQEASMDKIRRRVFTPGIDLKRTEGIKGVEGIDLDEALILARALGGMASYPYLQDILMRKARDLQKNGRTEACIRLLKACVEQEPKNKAFKCELDLALEGADTEKKGTP